MVHSTSVYPNWLKTGNRFWYQYKTTDGSKYYLVDADKRLRKQLSGVINFAKFREERLQLLAELTLQRDVLTDQRSKQSKKGYSISYNQSYGYMYNEYMACHIR